MLKIMNLQDNINLLISKYENTFLSNNRHKHSAMFFNKNRVFSIGFNYDTIHAEHSAITKLKPNKDKKIKVDLLVIRHAINKNNTYLTNSKPCIFCTSLISNQLDYRGLCP